MDNSFFVKEKSSKENLIDNMVNVIYTMSIMWREGEKDGSICSADVDAYTKAIIACCDVIIEVLKGE